MRDNTKYILKLQRECQESEIGHKLIQSKHENQQKILNLGIDVTTKQIAYNTMAMFNGVLRV